MARQLRIELPGGIFHVSSRGNNRQDIFFDVADRILFLNLLAKASVRFHWQVLAYVLMTNHFHLVYKTLEPTLSRGMKWLKQKYAQKINKKYKRSGHLFQGRFDSQLVEAQAYLLEVLRYTVLNPVRAGMVARPEDYEWSSYRATAGFEAAPEWLAVNASLMDFGPTVEVQRVEYRKFVDGGVGIERSPFENLVGQIYLGSREWVEKMQKLVESEPRSSEHPAEQLYAGRPEVAKVIRIVADAFGTNEEAVRNTHGGNDRRFVAWLCCYETNESNVRVAAALRLRSNSRVSALVQECEKATRDDESLNALLTQCVTTLRAGLQRVAGAVTQFYPGSAHQPVR
jgi:putative transposase